MRRPLLWRWLVLALLCALVAFSFALFAAEEAHAKGKSDGGGGGDRSGGGDGDHSGGGDSGGGGPIGDALGGASKDLLNDGGTGGGGGKEAGPLLSDSPLAADEPRAALADTKPVAEKASGGLLDGASGETTDRVLASEPIRKTTSPTIDPAPALAPAVEGTKDALEGVARPVSGELAPTTSETIRPLVGGVEEAAPATLTKAIEPVLDKAERLTTQPAALVEGAPHLVGTLDGAVDPIREALDPALGNTVKPLLKNAESLLNPVVGPVLGGVLPTTPLGDTPAALTPVGHIPAAELYAPVGGGIPALSPTTGLEPGPAAFEPSAAPVFEPFVMGEGASLPVMEAVEAPATLPPTVPSWTSSSVLGATESSTLAPLPTTPNPAAEAAAAASRDFAASLASLAMDTQEASIVPVQSPHHHWVTSLGTTVLGAAPMNWAESFLRDDPTSPFSPSTLPVAGSSAFGGSAGSGSGLGLGLLGALALTLAFARVNILLRSERETFGASSYLQLAIERPG